MHVSLNLFFPPDLHLPEGRGHTGLGQRPERALCL